MTYEETLFELLAVTRFTTIFGMFGHSNNGIYIGFRRECCWSDLKDPVIDDVPFMLCADAYDTRNKRREPIKTIEQLFETPNNDVDIDLRAVAFRPCYCTINLGTYRVNEMWKIGKKSGDFCVRLDIERNE